MMPLQSQIFTTPGSATFNVPPGVSLIFATGVGGGGAGGAGAGPVGFFYRGACGAASAEWCQRKPLVVTPGGTLSIVVGSGGVGTGNYDQVAGSAPSNGSNTTIGSFSLECGYAAAGARAQNQDNLTRGGGVLGYRPGSNNQTDGQPGNRESRSCWGGSGGSGSGSNSLANGRAGAVCGTYPMSGIGHNTVSGTGPGGGGAASFLGTGANGADGLTNGNDATAYGSAGGGAGGHLGVQTIGGDGMSGFVMIEWIAP